MLALMRPELYYTFFGITHANAVKIADECAAYVDDFVSTHGCAVAKGFSFVQGFAEVEESSGSQNGQEVQNEENPIIRDENGNELCTHND
jgi:hypothetical protein